MNPASLLALLANLFFSAATISYAEHSKKYGSLWVNSFKSFLSLLLMTILFFAMGFYKTPVDQISLLYMLSGLIGLALGDYLLVIGFEKIGPARTLLIFGIQPVLFLGIDLFTVPEKITWWAPFGVAFMLASLFLVIFEKQKSIYSWSLIGFLCGLFGVLLDFTGVLITKWAMNNGDHAIIEVYFWRMLGALIGLMLFHLILRKQAFRFTLDETGRDKWLFVLACVAGTFVSLWCYLKAIEIGPLSSVAAVAVTGPLFAGLFEWLFQKKPLTINLILSLFCFSMGFYLLS
jgi:drug/metabolite transporter (DMT)-like permease